MKLGIGQFSYHRYFGELTPWESDPGVRWNTNDFLGHAAAHRADTVGVQTCYLTAQDIETLPEMAAAHNLDVIIEWGHPAGLAIGKSAAAVQDLRLWIARASQWSFPLLRIVVGYPKLRGEDSVEVQTQRLVPILQEICAEALDWGVTIAIENHADFTPLELQGLIYETNRPNLCAVLDFGNCVRMGADLIPSIRSLAPLIAAVHLRDLMILPESIGNPLASWPTAPLGCGSLDIKGALRELYCGGFQGCLLLELAHLHPNWTEKEDEVLSQSLSWLKEWRQTG
jgi:sugar phosphate isomerase/epimerase